MEYNESELQFENKRLEQTIMLAKKQRYQAQQRNENNKQAILCAKRELRENTSHSISNLWSSEGFEALAELNQYVNPVNNKLSDYEEVEKEIATLDKIIKSPYFARFDFKFHDEDSFEKIYIGRSSLKKDNSYEMEVYDWRSPIASVFYRFVLGQVYYEAPSGRITGEINLKRQYEIKNGLLEYFFDADVHIVDEFLRKMLSKNTSTTMKTIVETIQKEQDIVIRDMDNDLMMVQGVAGSGKTSIALHRVAYLMYQGLQSKLLANNIIIISPNTLFEQYISKVLPELGESNVESVVFETIMSTVLNTNQIQSKNLFLEELITIRRNDKVMKSSIEFKTSKHFLIILDRFLLDVAYRWIEFNDIYYDDKCIITKESLREKIESRVEIPIGVKLKQLEDFIYELIYESKITIKKSNKHLLQSEIKRITEPSIINLYKKMFQDKEYFYSLTQGLELCDNIDDIIEFTKENFYRDFLCYEDAIVLTYLNLKLYGSNEYKNIKQVVIDEAQDYYPLQYEIFKLLFSNAKFTILGDMNQTLEKNETISLYHQINEIINKKKSCLITMDKSFRCTNEILKYSLKFIDLNTEIKSFNRIGEKPKEYIASDLVSLIEMIKNEVHYCKEKQYQSIGLICKSEKNAKSLYESLKEEIQVELIQNESTKDLNGVFIIPVYLSKGLEFDAVLICDADSKNYSSVEDKKCLYIASTRALHRLNLFAIGEASPLLV